jgi:hypothetical protein
VKVDPTSLKDLQTPIAVWFVPPAQAGSGQNAPQPTPKRPVTADSGKNGIVYASFLNDNRPPAKGWTLSVDNPNFADINLVLTVVFTTSSTS